MSETEEISWEYGFNLHLKDIYKEIDLAIADSVPECCCKHKIHSLLKKLKSKINWQQDLLRLSKTQDVGIFCKTSIMSLSSRQVNHYLEFHHSLQKWMLKKFFGDTVDKDGFFNPNCGEDNAK